MNPLVASILFSDETTGASSADLGETINQSLRFNGAEVLHRDFDSAATSNTTGTFSFWVKKSALITEQTIVMRDGNHWFAAFGNDDRFAVRQTGAGFSDFGVDLFRDPSAWYHFVVSINSNTATAFINGTAHATTLTTDDIFTGSTNSFRIGSESTTGASSSLKGYLAEFIFVDGQALNADQFGRTNDDGIWVPIEYEGTFGNNGYYLDFADSSDLGNDVSGRNNDFTAVGFVAADADILDTPTSNGVTLSNIDNSGMLAEFFVDLANTTLTVTDNSGYRNVSATLYPEGTKGYYEVTLTTGTPNFYVGFIDADHQPPTNNDYTVANLSHTLAENGDVRSKNDVDVRSNYVSSFSNGDVIGVAYDFTGGNRNVWFSRNGTFGTTAGGAGNPATGANPVLTSTQLDVPQRFYFAINTGGGDQVLTVNFGQTSYAQTPPTGFERVQINSLSTPTIKNGKDHFEAKLYSGTGIANTITGLNFAPGLIWIKGRTTTDNHVLVDTIRGTDSVIFPNTNDNQDSSFGRFTSFNSDGFEVDTTDSSWNESGKNYVAYCWKAGISTSTNDNGTRQSVVSVNDTAGFSMVSFNGTSGDTVGHGLSSKPQFIINRDVENDQHWRVFHAYMGVTEAYAVSDNIHLDLDDGFPAARGAGTRIDLVTDTTFRIAGGTDGAEQISYCWREVEGYSSFGVYQGLDVDPAGKSPDDRDYNFIYTGFKPAWLMIKCVQNAAGSAVDGDSWVIWNNASSPKNFAFETIMADTGAQEINSGDQFAIDIVSNGFKIRSSNNAINNASRDYIWMAFAEHPFGGQNTPPATAR